MNLYLELFLTFFKIGAFTIGGGYAMLPMIRDEVVTRGWITQSELIDMIAVSESTPGPVAINIATFVGNVRGGFPGSVLATLGVVAPSLIIILIVAQVYEKFKKSFAVKSVMSGLKPAVIGLIGAAILSMGVTVFFPGGIAFEVLKTPEFLISLATAGLMLFLILKVKLHPILIILASAAIGIASGYLLDL